jgi:hypothetical protein
MLTLDCTAQNIETEAVKAPNKAVVASLVRISLDTPDMGNYTRVNSPAYTAAVCCDAACSGPLLPLTVAQDFLSAWPPR